MKKDRKINFKKLTQINQHVKPQPLKTHRSLLEALERRDVIGSLLPFFPGGGLTPSVAKSLNMSMSQAFARLNMGEQKIVADAFETLSAALRDSDVPSPLPPTADDSSAAGSTQSVSSSWDGLSSQGDYVANLASAEDVAIDLSVDLQAESLNFSTDRVANLPSLNSLSSLKGTSVSMQKTPASPTFSAAGNGAPNLDGVRPTPLQTQGSQGNFNSSYQDSSETAAETDQSTAFSNGGSLKNADAPVAETPNAGAEPSSNAADADAPQANTEKVAFAYDLSDWTVSESGGSEQGRGSVTPIAQGALMAEGDSFVVEMRKTFVMTGEVDALSFAYEASFDASSTGLVKDAFEAALVDSEGYSLVKTFNRSRDSFFNLTEGLDPALGSQTTLSDESGLTRVTLDISSVPVGTECSLVFRLVNNDADAGGWVKIFAEKGQSGGAPEIMPFDVAETVEGAVVSLSADFIDSDAGEAHVATIDWGDGTVEAVAVVPTETGGTVSGEHIYADNGQYEATVSVIDAAGMGAACSTTVAVANAAPEMTDITTSFDGKMNANGTVDQYVVLAGTFTDPGFTNAAAGTEETFVLSVDWGDGTVEEYEPDVTQGGPGVLTVGEYSLRHSYQQGGIYTAVVTVRDDDGGEDAKESKFGYGEIEICLATTYPVVKPSRVKIPVNPSIRHGEIPVIVKSVGNLDATALNVSSVRFYPGDASDSNSQLIAADVDPFADGIADAIFHFSTTDAFIRPTDKIGWLTANFDDGTPFFGFDTIKATPISGAVSEAYDPRTAADSNTRFFVLDGEQDAVYRYTAEGRENSDFVLSDATPDVRDVTANVDGSKLWIVDGISRSVQTRSPDGWLLGAWRAVDVYSPQGIATNGTDIWIIDNLLHGVMRYDGAANLSEGNRTADAFFSLDADNIAPTGMATDGQKIWVSDSYADKIFVYDAFAGTLLGSWSLAPENGFAAGVTNDPTGESDSIWVVDSETLNVYEYAAAAALLTGSAVLAGTFALAEGNTRPVGIVDPAVISTAQPSVSVAKPTIDENYDVDSVVVVTGTATPGQSDALDLAYTVDFEMLPSGQYAEGESIADQYAVQSGVAFSTPGIDPATLALVGGEQSAFESQYGVDTIEDANRSGMGFLTFAAVDDPRTPSLRIDLTQAAGKISGDLYDVDSDAETSFTVFESDGTPGWYNDSLGTILDGTSWAFPISDDPTYLNADEPDLSPAADVLGNWLTADVPPQNGNWNWQSIPTKWGPKSDNAIVYEIDGGPGGIANLKADIGVDNGVFIWLNGEYVFGAMEPGSFSSDEYAGIDFGSLRPGKNYLQVLREDHGVTNGFTIKIYGETITSEAWRVDGLDAFGGVVASTTIDMGAQGVGDGGAAPWELTSETADIVAVEFTYVGNKKTSVDVGLDNLNFYTPKPSATVPIVAVYVNNDPVDVLDVAGNFFYRTTVEPGLNEYVVTAIDANGGKATTSTSVWGTTPGDGIVENLQFDVSPSFKPDYARTSFDDRIGVLYAQLAIENVGQYAADAPFYVGVRNISDMNVVALDPVGVTKDGIPYYDVSDSIQGGALNPNDKTLWVDISFLNPGRNRFTYELVYVYKTNEAPIFVTAPSVEAYPDKAYSYASRATDPNRDPLTYSLVVGPDGMTVDAKTGDVAWTPTDLGVYSVVLRVEDGRGGSATQTYAINVVEAPENRPPVITSYPPTSATVVNYKQVPGGKIVVAADEWTLSDDGFWNDYEDTATFVENVARWFTDGETGNFLALSENFGLRGDALANVMISNGHQWTGTTETPTLEELLEYDGVFLGGNTVPDNQLLIDYVNAGGCVYLCGGTYNENETRDWGVFLEAFGLGFYGRINPDGDAWNHIYGVIPIDAKPHPIFENVSALYQQDGHDIVDLDESDSKGVFVATINGMGQYAVYDSAFDVAEAGSGYVYQVEAYDPDGDSVTYSLGLSPEGMWINPNNGAISWAPTVDQIGENVVTVIATDEHGATDTQTYSIMVYADPNNHDPIIISEPTTTVIVSEQTSLCDLSNWRQYVYADESDPEPNWVLSNNNTVAIQTENAKPSILLSDFNVLNQEISGNWSTSDWDDDFMGFVFGYQNSGHFYLFDWKGGSQSWSNWGTAEKGMSVKRVSSDEEVTGRELWNSDNNEYVTTLYHNSIGWENDVEYTFNLVFKDDEFVITVSQDDLVLDVITLSDDAYEDGKFGFYNYSQGNVRYNGFYQKNLGYDYTVVAVDPDEDDVTYALLYGPENAAIDPQTGKLSWITELGTYSFTVLASDGHGGTDVQTFVVNVTGEGTSSITGTVYEDVNRNGRRDTTLVPGDNPLVVFVVDASGSMDASYTGDKVGDLNGDGRDDRLDAVVYAITQYQQQLVNLGLGASAELALITFSQPSTILDLDPVTPGKQSFVSSNADANNNGISDVVEVARNIRHDRHWTYYDEALREVITVINEKAEPNRETLVIFLTDGAPQYGHNGVSQAQQLLEMGVTINACGVGDSNQLKNLQKIDPNAVWFDNMNDLYDLFSGMDGEYVQFSEQGIAGITVYADLNHNGIYDSNEPSAITDSDGKYAITGLPAGDFVVRVDVPANGVQTQPIVGTGYNVALGEGQSFETDPFGLYYLGDGDSGALTIVSTPPNTATVGEVYRYDVQTVNPSGSVLDFTLLSAPSGMGIHHDLGTIVWRPTNADVGEYQAVVKVRNANGEVATQAFTINVEAANHAPVITTDSIPTPVLAASPYRAYIYAQDADNDALTYSLVGAPDGMTVDPATGVLDWTPEAALIGSTVAATVVVTDARGKSAKKTYNLAVVETLDNDEPIITSTPRTRTRMELPYVYLIQAYDPNGDRLTFSVSGTAADGTPIIGITCDPDTGLIQWTPSAADQGTATVAVSVSDGRGGVATQTYALDVITLAENTAPRIISTPARTGIVGKTWRYEAQAVDDDGDFVYWRLKDAPDGASINFATGEIYWVPTYQQLAANVFTVVCTDVYGASTEQTFTVTIRGINRPPVIVSTPNSAAATESLYVYAVRAKDSDGDSLKFSLVEGAYPSGMTIDEELGFVRWTPSAGDVGLRFVTVQVDDGVGGVDTQTYSINVIDSALNNPPVITSTPAVATSVGSRYSYKVVAKDPEGDAITYALEEGPATASFDAASGRFEWSPTAGDIGSVRVVVSAIDAYGKRAIQSYTLTVRENQAPTITSKPSTSATPTALYSYDVQATDPENDALTYSLQQAPEGMTIDEYGRLRWTPALSQLGASVSVVVAATDTYGNVGTQAFTINVEPDRIAPEARLVFKTNVVKMGETARIQVQAIDNVGVESVSLMVGGTERGLAWDAASQLYWADVPFEKAGGYEVYATATDYAGNVGKSDAYTFYATDPNDSTAPVITFHALYPQVYNDEKGKLVDDAPITGDDIFYSPVLTYLTDLELSIVDDNMANWTIEVASTSAVDLNKLSENSEAYRVIDKGVGALDHYRVRIDPTILANDAYVLRVTGYDANGQGTISAFTFGVEGGAKLGQFAFTTTDMYISRNGISLSVQRTYDSAQANQTADFGYGWTLAIADPKIAETTRPENEMVDGDRVYITAPDGERVGFTYKPTVTGGSLWFVSWTDTTAYFEPDPGVEWTLTCLETPPSTGGFIPDLSGEYFNPANYVLTSKDGTSYYYKQKNGEHVTFISRAFDYFYSALGIEQPKKEDDSGLYKIVDPNGIELTVTKDGISHSAGGFLTFERDARGRITSITDHMDMTVTYKYDASGDLVAFSNQIDSKSNEPTITYKYRKNPAHFLEEAYDKNGDRVFKAEFDEDGRLVGMTDALGNVVQQEFDPGAMNGTIRDANGNVTTVWYDDRGNVTLEEKPVTNVLTGETTVYTKTYDYGDERFPDKETRVVDYNGTVTEYVYDDAGNQARISITSPDGTTSVYSDKTYDGKGNVTSETLPDIGLVSYVYDTAGNTTSTIIEDSVATSTYSSEGKETSFVDANGNVVKMEYPDDCPCTVPREVNWEDGSQIVRYWNRHGSVTRMEYYESDGSLSCLSSITYDDLNRKQTQITGNVTEQGDERYAVGWDYDGDSERISHELVYNIADPDNSVDTYFYYDKVGNLIRKVEQGLDPNDPNAGVFYKYDGNGNVVWQRDAVGNVTTWIYDSMNRVAEERDSLYWAEKNVDWSSMTDKEILALISTPTAPAANGVYAPSHTIRYAYDGADHIVEKVDQNGRRISYSYDYLGNKTTETWHDETDDVTPIYVVTYGYNEKGQLTSAISPDAEYALTYNDMGYLKTLSVDYPWSANFETFTISYEYDAMGNVVSQTDSSGLTVRSEYNGRNMLSSRWWEGAGVDDIRVDFTYNVLGNITSVTRWADTARSVKAGTSEYTYDLAGRATGITHKDALGKVLADYDYEYDFANRLVEEALSSVVDGASRTAFYGYDELGQLISAMYDNGQANETFAWDANGNSKAPGAVIGAGNRLLSDGTFDYQYDFAGNMIAKTRINAVVGEANYIEYKYDYNNRLVAVDEYSSKGGVLLHTETYRHDMFGRRVQVVSDGTETISTFGSLGELANEWARFDAEGNVIQRFLFGAGVDQLIAQWAPEQGILWALTDRLGSVRDLVNNAGQIMAHMNYTAFGSPILTAPNASFAKYLASYPFAFTGRTWDMLANMSYFRARTFDPMTGRFTTADPLRFDAGDMNLYRYLNNSPFMGKDPSGKFAWGYVLHAAMMTAIIGAFLSPVYYTVCKIWVNKTGDITFTTILEKTIKGAFWGALIGGALATVGLLAAYAYVAFSETLVSLGATEAPLWLAKISKLGAGTRFLRFPKLGALINALKIFMGECESAGGIYTIFDI